MPVIDAHLHLFKSVSDEYPREVFEPMTPTSREENAETYIKVMESAGVDKAVAVALSPHDQYLSFLHATYPDRFATVAVIDETAEDQVGELERRIETCGLQGYRLFALGDEQLDPEQLPLFPLLETMSRLEIKVWFYADAAQVDLLDRTLELLPELTVVMNHLGFCPSISSEMTIDDDLRPQFSVSIPPDSLEAVQRVSQREHVYVHFSGMYAFSRESYPYPEMAAMVGPIYEAFGPERILMASDYPWIYRNPGYPETLALVDEHLPDLSAEDRSLIRGGNAARLFSFS